MQSWRKLHKSRLAFLIALIIVLIVVASMMIINMVDGLTGSVNNVQKIKVGNVHIQSPIAELDVSDGDAIISGKARSEPDTDILLLRSVDLSEKSLDTICEKLPKLENIEITGSVVPPKSISKLQKLSRLKALSLNNTPLGNEGLQAASKISSLNKLKVVSTGITDDGLTCLSKLKNLKTLDISQNNLTDKSIHNLLPCSDRIDILLTWHNNLTAAGLRDLQKFTKLKILNIGSCGLSADDLCLLGKLQHLDLLRLPGQDFRQTDFSHFATSMPQVSCLVLNESKLGNKQLLALAKMKNLKRIVLTQSASVTPYGYSELKRLRPDITTGEDE